MRIQLSHFGWLSKSDDVSFQAADRADTRIEQQLELPLLERACDKLDGFRKVPKDSFGGHGVGETLRSRKYVAAMVDRLVTNLQYAEVHCIKSG